MDKVLIEIRDMHKIYNPGENEVRALDGVDLTIYENEFVAIIGHSGSGKSTLMNMLGCLDVPTSGTYRLHDIDVSDMEDDELSDVRNREIGFIFQGFNLISNLTAIENVELPLVYRGVDRKTRHKLAVESLTMVGLEKRMDHKPNEMSGGQQQRALLARALCAAKKLILLDEPVTGLDPVAINELYNLIGELNQSDKITIIMVSHDIQNLLRNTKHVLHLNESSAYYGSVNDYLKSEIGSKFIGELK